MVDFDQIKQNRYVYSKETGKKYFSNQELFQSKEKHKNLIYELDDGKWSNFNWKINWNRATLSPESIKILKYMKRMEV